MNDLSPFDFFRQETSHADAVVRTEAMKKVALVAALMGPEKTRTDMLAYLQTKVDDLDQVLLVLSEKLEKFVPLVGGPEHAHLLIPLFEALCDIEEVTVRNVAATSVTKVLKQLSPGHKNQVLAYFELLKRMSNEESGEVFYSRCSSCPILAELYHLLNDSDMAAVREIFTRLCKDEMPIVRRSAVLQFMRMATLVDVNTLHGEMSQLMKALVVDESQIVQALSVEYLSPFATLLKKTEGVHVLSNEILPLIKAFSDDPSWRVRQSISKGFGTFAGSFMQAEVSADVFPSLIHLVLDPEAEVRTVAVPELLPFLEVVGTSHFISELAPVAVQLVEDPTTTVRKLLAEVCVSVAAKVGAEAVALHMSDLIMKLMDDEDPLVRLRIIKKLPLIAEQVPSLCTRLTEALKAMFTNSNWRVRKALVEAMPAVVKFMGQEYFIDHFLSLSLLLVKDGVDEVRVAASASLADVAGVTDPNWVHEKIFPTFKTYASEEYLIRVTMLSAFQNFLKIENLPERFRADAMAQLIQGTQDKVPNIRVRAAQIVQVLLNLPHLGDVRDQLQDSLTGLSTDKDKDVRYFATHARTK
eukprot:gene25713-31052_t